MPEHRFHAMPDGRRIAFRLIAGSGLAETGPALVFLPGYMSDMSGSKATAIADWAQANGRACLLLSAAGTPPKTILVTSGQASEGKTTTAVNMAISL